jgi:hypothetical protein
VRSPVRNAPAKWSTGMLRGHAVNELLDGLLGGLLGELLGALLDEPLDGLFEGPDLVRRLDK